MHILAIDTSTAIASVAIAVDEKIIAESNFNSDRSLSARLIPEIEKILETAGVRISDIDLFAASIGPGSFTGVRGGLATIQGLALATGKQCAGFSSLALLAMNYPLSTQPVCPMLDARKSEVYAALYDCSTTVPAPILSDCVMTPARFLEQLCSTTDKVVIFTGEGAQRYHDLIAERMGDHAVFAPDAMNVSHAGYGTVLALHAFNSGKALEPSRLLPVYLRASDAEINLAIKRQST